MTNREGKGEIFCLITTIMDPQDATAAELAAAYQERWEFESSLDEIKTHQRGRNRSSPRVVKRVHAHAYRAKRSADTTTLYLAPPNIHILAVP